MFIVGLISKFFSHTHAHRFLLVLALVMLPGTYGMSIVVGHLKGWIRNDTRGLILYD